MLSSGSRRLADKNAVVKTLADVEAPVGATASNSDKTGTLTLNQMNSTTMLGGTAQALLAPTAIEIDKAIRRRG